MKRLLWKEWCENRMLAIWMAPLLGLAIVAITMLDQLRAEDTCKVLFGSWILAGVFAGSGLISREIGSGTLQFLISLPMSRNRIWWIKLGAGMLTLAACIVTTTLVWALLHGFMYWSFSHAEVANLSYAPWLALCALVALGVTTALSTLMDRSLSAAMAGVVTCLVLTILVTMFVLTFQIFSDIMVETGILAALFLPAFLMASYWSFTRGESLRTRRRLFWAAGGLLTGMLLVWTPSLAVYSRLTQFHHFASHLDQPVISPDAKYLAISAKSHPITTTSTNGVGKPYTVTDYAADHLVVRSLDGNKVRRVLPGGKVLAWSPNGRYLFYKKSVGPWGLPWREDGGSAIAGSDRLSFVDLLTGQARQVALPGEHDWLVDASFSPDGEWLACLSTQYVNYTVSFYHISQWVSGAGPIHPRARIDCSSYEGYTPSFTLRQAGAWSVLAQRLAWSSNSHYLYAVADGRLLALDPGTGSSAPGTHLTSYTLCTFPSQEYDYLTVTRNSHRALLTLYFTGGDHRPPDNRVIDLEAATTAAVSRQKKSPAPYIRGFIRQWRQNLNPWWGDQPVTISPDGRFLLSLENSTSRVRKPGPVGVSDLENAGQGVHHVVGASFVSLPTRWMPDGHRFWTKTAGGQWNVVDLVTGRVQPVATEGAAPIGSTPDGRLLWWPTGVRDAFHPVEESAQI